MKRIISLLMENEPGALSRVVGLFSQRGYNIETLNVAPTEDETLSRLTLSTDGDAKTVEQICKHLDRLLDVARVDHLSTDEALGGELAMVKLAAPDAERRAEIEQALEPMRAQLIDVAAGVCVAQLAGNSEEMEAFIAALTDFEPLEIARSGVVGLSRNALALKLDNDA